MTDLIERIQSGDVGRELSDEVLLACGWSRIGRDGRTVFWLSPDDERYVGHGPEPLRSLDAAVDLMPEGWSYCVNVFPAQMRPTEKWTARAHINPNDGGGRSGALGDAPTPAAALVIAILRAREVGG